MKFIYGDGVGGRSGQKQGREKHTDKETEMIRWSVGRTDRWTGGRQTDGRAGGMEGGWRTVQRTDGRTDGRTGGQIYG